MLQHVADNIGQIVLSDNLLLITQFGDALRDPSRLLRCQFQAQFLQVLSDIRLTAVLAQGILTLASETLRHQFVVVELILRITIGMDASHLRKHILANDRLIRCYGDAAEALHHPREIIELTLYQIRLGMKLVLQDGLHGSHRCVAASLTQPVHGDMQSFCATQHGSQRIAYRQVVVVVGMEVEMNSRIAFDHLAEILDDLQRIHHAQCIRQHETLNRGER